MSKNWEDMLEEFEDEADDQDGLEADAEDADDAPELTAEEAEAAEAQARADANAQAEAIIKQVEGYEEAPVAPHPDATGPGTEEAAEEWFRYLQADLQERATKRAEVEAVFEAEQAALEAAGTDDEDLGEIDFSTWDSASFADLMARVDGQKPVFAPRHDTDDEEFERALIRFQSEVI